MTKKSKISRFKTESKISSDVKLTALAIRSGRIGWTNA
jgi:hypothetical protein